MTTATIKSDYAIKYLLDGTIDLDTDVLKVALLTSAYDPRPGTAAWNAATIYAANMVVTSAGRYYEAIVGGTSSGALPLFSTTVGATTTDNTVTWYCWGYAPPSVHTVFGDVSADEISGTGYSAGGATMSGVAVTQSAHGAVFSASATEWPASAFTARYAVIYKSGTTNGVVSPILCYILLDDTGADVGTPVSGVFRLAWSSLGIFAIN